MDESALPSWHALSPAEAATAQNTTLSEGLPSNEAAARLRMYGPNKLRGKRRKTRLEKFLSQFHQPLVYILLLAGGVTGFLGEWVDSWVIFGVVIINAVIGYIQEDKASNAIESLASTMRTEATVLRDGKSQRTNAENLVPGDVVLLRSGDKVPADMRLHEVKELRTDESALTGESLPIEKTIALLPAPAGLADRTNMAYAGTLVTFGTARGLVIATGAQTEVGRISTLIDEADELQTPLTRKIAAFSHILLLVIMALAVLTFGVGLLRDEPVIDVFMASVALAVGAIPEGLPAAVTIILAIGVSRMAARKAIIRKLPAVETLGSVNVICSDKTGTLTENQMTVQQIWAGGGLATVSGTGYALAGEVTIQSGPKENLAVGECLRAGLLCNDAKVVRGNERPVVEGDPTEAALIVAAEKYGLSAASEAQAYRRIDEIPFESDRQYMATLHETPKGRMIFMKGSAERVWALCQSAQTSDGGLIPFDQAGASEQLDLMAAQGLRVLALACKPAHSERLAPDDLTDMIFLGLQGMMDPPRPEAIQAVAACHKAGIDVKMITGDHIGTAVAIARKLGLRPLLGASEGPLQALSGPELERLPDEALPDIVLRTSVFARVTPEQKLRLVGALQARGYITAMTGDGVNDAPALKQSNIGVAMGITGTDTAKEAADMVLVDDNFATIQAAVEEGRGVYDNLIKFIAWTLPTNIGEGLVILAAFAIGATLPILPVQLLWINMTTAVCLGMMLAFEKKEGGLMDRKPRDPDTPILSSFIIQRILMVSFLLLVAAFGLFEWKLTHGSTDAEARTIAVNVFILVETAYLFNTRSFLYSPFAIGFLSNPWTVLGAMAMILLQILFTYAPFMNDLFGSAPLPAGDWGIVTLISLGVFGLVEIEKKIRGRLPF